MLIDFTVQNYRSIKEPVTLSAVAQQQGTRSGSQNNKRKRVKSNSEIAPGYLVEGWNIELLPVLAIFGANASGKSNVIQALDYLLLLMVNGNQETSRLQKTFRYAKLDTFKLDNISSKKSTVFELRTTFNNAIYTYSLEIIQSHIISESLEYALIDTKRTRRLFSRAWDENTKTSIWKNGSSFKGPHTQLQSSIRENEPYISTLIKLKVDILEPLFNWLRGRFIGIHLASDEFDIFGFMLILQDSEEAQNFHHNLFEQALNIVKNFDTGLSGIKIDRKSQENTEYKLYALHRDNEGKEISWSLDEESLGTQRLFNLAYRMLIALKIGSLTIVDELGTNIHPNIVKNIIKLFQNPNTNPKRAQLIFTSHDNTLQRNNLLRRDQIWFTQKRADQSTELYPLSDFHVRNDLAIDKAYLDGRFGAVPFLPSDEEMILKGDELCQES
ncbi:hypothetical protein CAL7716_034460 [Calothrix sp. PCC 7716]|nr:hypothetical protein CAL7716_034460 [Calothrix sp. PCC 7716]